LTIYGIKDKIVLMVIQNITNEEVRQMGDKNPKKAPKKKGSAQSTAASASTKKK